MMSCAHSLVISVACDDVAGGGYVEEPMVVVAVAGLVDAAAETGAMCCSTGLVDAAAETGAMCCSTGLVGWWCPIAVLLNCPPCLGCACARVYDVFTLRVFCMYVACVCVRACICGVCVCSCMYVACVCVRACMWCVCVFVHVCGVRVCSCMYMWRVCVLR
jgi:hypothetical protein